MLIPSPLDLFFLFAWSLIWLVERKENEGEKKILNLNWRKSKRKEKFLFLFFESNFPFMLSLTKQRKRHNYVCFLSIHFQSFQKIEDEYQKTKLYLGAKLQIANASHYFSCLTTLHVCSSSECSCFTNNA